MGYLNHVSIAKTSFLAILIFGFSNCKQQTQSVEIFNYYELPLQRLIKGNIRFAQGNSIHADESIERLKSVVKEQHPFAVVVSCSDSRVSPEILFDQGIGDIFTIRTAGNIIGNVELGSIENALEHLIYTIST